MNNHPKTQSILDYLVQQFPATEGHVPLREKIGKLEDEIISLHKECQKYRVALNRIAHPESWSINEGFEAEIARRALVIGMKVEELPEGAAKV